MDVVQSSLALFQPPLLENIIQKEKWIKFQPLANMSEGSVIEFQTPGTSMDYIDLKKSKLCLQII